jgi:UDP-glucuronate decarboxylase
MLNKVLVTGGAGFIGSHLCKKLIERGNAVYCLDNFFTGSKENIKQLISNSNFSLLEHNIIIPCDLEVDQIYNLACPASPIHYQLFPVGTIKTNVLGAMNMLDLANKNKAKILQSSTSEIYGDSLISPQNETYWGNVNPIGIRSCYDEGKRCAETLFFDYNRQYKTDIRVVRIFNTYGPNMNINDGRVISNFIVQALRGNDITIYGNGLQTRSFCYVDDMINALILMMDNDFIGPINLGNENEFTIVELAELVLSLINSKSKLIYKELPQDDPKQRKPDISLARNKLEWEPKIQLKDGLIKTIEYFKEQLCK